MESKEQKVACIYAYNAVLALCLLHAAFLGVTFAVSTGESFNAFTDVINRLWVPLFLIWPFWFVPLLILWFFGDRKRWRLLVSFGVGIVFVIVILLFVIYIIWRIAYHGWHT